MNSRLSLPPRRHDNVPVTVIFWTDGGRSERHGHLTDEDIRAHYGTREPISVAWTTTDEILANGGNLFIRPDVVMLMGVSPKV